MATSLAIIRAAECIGCSRCLPVCPVDAIVGSKKQLHVVLNSECIGCGLCIAPCPVDCIELLPVTKLSFKAEKAKQRHKAHVIRFEKNSAPALPLPKGKEAVLAAVARAKAKREGQSHGSW